MDDCEMCGFDVDIKPLDDCELPKHWRAYAKKLECSLVAPGWFCPKCKVWNGEMKERRATCRNPLCDGERRVELVPVGPLATS